MGQVQTTIRKRRRRGRHHREVIDVFEWRGFTGHSIATCTTFLEMNIVTRSTLDGSLAVTRMSTDGRGAWIQDKRVLKKASR